MAILVQIDRRTINIDNVEEIFDSSSETKSHVYITMVSRREIELTGDQAKRFLEWVARHSPYCFPV